MLVCWYWYVGMLVCWYVGMLVCWYVGMLVCWFVGLLVRWYVGMLVCWFVGLLVCCCCCCCLAPFASYFSNAFFQWPSRCQRCQGSDSGMWRKAGPAASCTRDQSYPFILLQAGGFADLLQKLFGVTGVWCKSFWCNKACGVRGSWCKIFLV